MDRASMKGISTCQDCNSNEAVYDCFDCEVALCKKHSDEHRQLGHRSYLGHSQLWDKAMDKYRDHTF